MIALSIFSNLHRARAKEKDWEVKQFESLWTHEQDKQDSQVKVNNVWGRRSLLLLSSDKENIIRWQLIYPLDAFFKIDLDRNTP